MQPGGTVLPDHGQRRTTEFVIKLRQLADETEELAPLRRFQRSQDAAWAAWTAAAEAAEAGPTAVIDNCLMR